MTLLVKELHSVAAIASRAGAKLEVEVHHSTGSFYTDFMDGFAVAYANISSVVARLSWPSSRRDAILLGAHYDSFPTSPGSSDNAANVAASIGAVRALATGPPLACSVLLLLNGAEESFMIAAHGFALSHRWAHDYRVVLNLEAIGAGGAYVAPPALIQPCMRAMHARHACSPWLRAAPACCTCVLCTCVCCTSACHPVTAAALRLLRRLPPRAYYSAARRLGSRDSKLSLAQLDRLPAGAGRAVAGIGCRPLPPATWHRHCSRPLPDPRIPRRLRLEDSCATCPEGERERLIHCHPRCSLHPGCSLLGWCGRGRGHVAVATPSRP